MTALAWPAVALVLGLGCLVAALAMWTQWLEHRSDALLDDAESARLDAAIGALKTAHLAGMLEATDRLVRLENKLGITR